MKLERRALHTLFMGGSDPKPAFALESQPMHKPWLIMATLGDADDFIRAMQRILETSYEVVRMQATRANKHQVVIAHSSSSDTAPVTHAIEDLKTQGEASISTRIPDTILKLKRFDDRVAFSCNSVHGRESVLGDEVMSIVADVEQEVIQPFVHEYRVRTAINNLSHDIHPKLLHLHLSVPALTWFSGGRRTDIEHILLANFCVAKEVWLPIATYYGVEVSVCILLFHENGNEVKDMEEIRRILISSPISVTARSGHASDIASYVPWLACRVRTQPNMLNTAESHTDRAVEQYAMRCAIRAIGGTFFEQAHELMLDKHPELVPRT